MTRPQEVFLSHASADRAAADRLAVALRSHGVPVWYSGTDLIGAQQWHDEIGSALRRCDWFMLLASNRALDSFWVKRELHYALQQRRFVGRIIPVLLECCPLETLSWALSALQVVSFTAGFEAGCRELLRTWGVGYTQS